MAGPGGVEPPKLALEASGLPLAYGPRLDLRLFVKGVLALFWTELAQFQRPLLVYFALFESVVDVSAFATL